MKRKPRTPFARVPSTNLFRNKHETSPNQGVSTSRFVIVDEIGLGDLCQELTFDPKYKSPIAEKYVMGGMGVRG